MTRSFSLLALALTTACAAPTQSETARAPNGTVATPSRSAVSTRLGNSAQRLVVEATGCWMGGLWSDALSSELADRSIATQQRCKDLVTQEWGRDDQLRYLRLRAVEPGEVAELDDRLLEHAKDDGLGQQQTEDLAKLFDAIAAAQREANHVRRAADRVKLDFAGERGPGKLTGDEVAASHDLARMDALKALYEFDRGGLGPEARSLALVFTMDRMATARGLPKQLKVYAVGGPFHLVLGSPLPALPSEATAPLEPGEWLTYLSNVARDAKHPVSPSARSLVDKETSAWAGTAMGLADKLAVETERPTLWNELRATLGTVTRRIELAYGRSEEALHMAPKPPEKSPTARPTS
jgi:hypothetical protein